MRLESLIAGGATSLDHVHFALDLVGTVIGETDRLGIATAEELVPDTLVDRVFAEVAATESVVVGRAEIGAWPAFRNDTWRTLRLAVRCPLTFLAGSAGDAIADVRRQR